MPSPPPRPVRLIFPAPEVITALFLKSIPDALSATLAEPLPVRVIFPPAELRVAPSSKIPSIKFAVAVPTAGLVVGSEEPPPKTILPPLELITEPVFSRIAPPTPASSISALRVTLRRPEVEVISAPLRKIILLFASKVRSASPPSVFSILLSTKIFPG